MNKDITNFIYIRFVVFYGHRFTQNHTPEIIEAWHKDWEDCLIGIPLDYIKLALNHCKLNLKWPPTMAEFLDICDQSSGLPSPEEALDLALKRDFTKPLVQKLFDAVTSFEMKESTREELLKRFKNLHAIELAHFRTERQKQYLLEKGISNDKQVTEQGRFANNGQPRVGSVQKIEKYLPH